MATLYPFIAQDARAGQKVDLKLRKVIWTTVGRGQVKTLSDYEVEIAGKISVVVYSGDLNIRLRLPDGDGNATSGICLLGINSHFDENAKFKVDGDTLAVDADFSGTKAGIRLSRYDQGKMTKCRLSGYVGLTTYLQAAD